MSGEGVLCLAKASWPVDRCERWWKLFEEVGEESFLEMRKGSLKRMGSLYAVVVILLS